MADPICVGDWKREKELGSGGFGVVSLWTNTNGESLAIKKCRWTELHLTPKQKERWSTEVAMMQEIKNANIVCYRKMPQALEKALSCSNPSKLPMLSMEYCSLGNLRNMLMEPQNACGFSEMEVINILQDVSSALMHLHDYNITHRDIKPENIVVNHCNTRRSNMIYKVIDLGYAKEIESATVSFVGTLQYLAPEIFEKKSYTKNVDYWSLGITAFEIICGLRPFLPTFKAPMQSFDYVKKKDSDIICIQLTHTGDIKSSREIPKENHVNVCLKQCMEKWFRSVLQFDPQKRGVLENNNVDVFLSLQKILSKKIITVFSVYNYEFYSYEINDSTLYSTLQDWIARDLKIHKTDQYLISSKRTSSHYALDYYDETNPDAMLFVFKRNASISKHAFTNVPKLIKLMFEKIGTEFKFGTLPVLHAQTIYLICQETKHLRALKNGICFLRDVVQITLSRQSRLFVDVRFLLQSLLHEIEFSNDIETSLCTKVYKDTNNVKLNAYLLEYEHYLSQLIEIIELVNALPARHAVVVKKNQQLQCASNVVMKTLGNCHFGRLAVEAAELYEVIFERNQITNFSAEPKLLKTILSTTKIRDKALRDNVVLHFIRAATSCLKELSKLLSCLSGIEQHLKAIRNSLRQNQIRRLEILRDPTKKKGCEAVKGINGINLIKENVVLRYEMQELMDKSFLKYKNMQNIGEKSAFGQIVENGVIY